MYDGQFRYKPKRKVRKVVWSLSILAPMAYALEVPAFSALTEYTSGDSDRKTKNPLLSVYVCFVSLGDTTVTSTSAAGCPV